MSKSKYPEQINPTTAGRRAIAPYNFIQLPEQVIAAEDAGDLCVHNDLDTKPHLHLVRQDSYHAGRHTGQITATLRAVSPLYTRTGLSPEEFAAISGKSFSDLSVAEKQRYAEFFQLNGVPTLPGSSLRGMLRTLVEIVTQSKLTRVMRDGLVYRAVGDTSSVGKFYRDEFLEPEAGRVRYFRPLSQAGYMYKSSSGWKIKPAQLTHTSTGSYSYARIEFRNPNLIPTGATSWKPHITNAKRVWVAVDPPDWHEHAKKTRYPVHLWYAVVKSNPRPSSICDPSAGLQEGVLVETGHMPNKHMHFVFNLPEVDEARFLDVPQQIEQLYQDQLTDPQKEHLGSGHGIFQQDQPVFYLLDKTGKVRFVGHAQNFRLPYPYSPLDFVPPDLRKPTITDIAEAMFGYVPQEKEDTRQAYAGRVFVDDAALVEEQRGTDVWLDLQGQPYLVPHILSGPKPTTFQHYLVQPQENRRDLKHYASTPVTETVIRGHKLYWHKCVVAPDDANDANHTWLTHLDSQVIIDKTKTQHTGMRPVKPDTRFALSIRFENLSDVELGALLWLLQLACDPGYALKLGMGKPLGLGSVQLEGLTVTITDRRTRYTTLLNDAGDWETGAAVWNADRQKACVTAFQSYIVQPSRVAFEQLPRTQQLRCMLAWPGPDSKETRYMEIERDERKDYVSGKPRNGKVNEYAERPILPPANTLCSSASGAGPHTAAQPLQQRTPPSASSTRTTTESHPTPPTNTTTAPSPPEIGGVFTGEILEVKAQRVLISVPKFADHFAVIEQEHWGNRQYRVGEQARVVVIGIEERKGKPILKVKPSPKSSP
ncbi:TIGR03986 family CRISPR-associated RAMP protein [bacterium]|nr:TIGR03986 family CRISPR-associated RAMP protein [bacterium]